MRPTTLRPNAKLLTIAQAEREYGLPAALIRDLIHRGVLAAVRPPGAVPTRDVDPYSHGC